MRRKKQQPLTSNVKSDVSGARNRKVREGLTRVGVVTSPIKGRETHAKQWNRWTP